MKLEQQVCSLELAKKLKELGVKQESLFYFVRISDTPDGRQDWLIRNSKWGKGAKEEYSAFTVAELGEMLPARNIDFGKGYFESCKDSSGMWRAYWTDTHSGKWIKDFNEVSEADARAKMLIYLIENKLQTINQKEEV